MLFFRLKKQTSKNVAVTTFKSTEIRKIKSSPNVFVFAVKTNNIYEMSENHHQKLLPDNVTKAYQKLPKLETSINLEAKSLSTKLKISDRAESIAKTRAFVTLKDHKDNFRSNPTCRLINTSKTNLEK